MSSDPRELRQASRAAWGRVSVGWEQQADRMRRQTMPVSTWLVEAVGPQPGFSLLELAAGPGDTGFLAAELITPGGELLTSDFAPEMLTVAQARAERAGIRNVRFKQIDAEAEIDLPTASLDGVICRWGYMLMADPESALRETRRVLKPGRRLSLAAWTSSKDNEWASIPVRKAIEAGLIAQPPPPPTPGQFAWGKPGAIQEAVEAVGFTDVRVEAVDFTYDFADFDDYYGSSIRALSGMFNQALDSASAEQEQELIAAVIEGVSGYEQPDGSLTFPARTWVAVASA